MGRSYNLNMRHGVACMLFNFFRTAVENRSSSSPSLLQTCQRQIRLCSDLSGSQLPREHKDVYYRTDPHRLALEERFCSWTRKILSLCLIGQLSRFRVSTPRPWCNVSQAASYAP